MKLHSSSSGLWMDPTYTPNAIVLLQTNISLLPAPAKKQRVPRYLA